MVNRGIRIEEDVCWAYGILGLPAAQQYSVRYCLPLLGIIRLGWLFC